MFPPKRVAERIIKSVGKFQQVLQIAKDRDVNESDTLSIIKDMLAEVFGYDKYIEITSELAIKVDNKIEYIIEAKAIGTALKESHIRQAIEYGSNNGVPWVILTNGMLWRIYKIRFEQPITYDLVCDFSFSEIDGKSEEHQEKLFIICKEGINKDAREQFHEKIQCLNRFILGALILSDDVLAVLRRELRKITEGVLVASEDLIHVLKNEVLKRDIIEGEEAQKAQTRVKRYYGKTARKLHEEDAPTETKAQTEQAK